MKLVRREPKPRQLRNPNQDAIDRCGKEKILAAVSDARYLKAARIAAGLSGYEPIPAEWEHNQTFERETKLAERSRLLADWKQQADNPRSA